MKVSESFGSPTFSDSTSSLSAATTSSYRLRGARMRVWAMHDSPLLSREPNFRPATAFSMSASGRMIAADLPPSSRLTRLNCSPAIAAMRRPARVEPVKAILSTSLCDTRYSLVSRSAGRTLITPSGRPTCSRSSARKPMLREFSGETLRTTELPATRAGMIFEVAEEKGEFHGMTAATTPIASRRTTLRTGEVGSEGWSVSSQANSSAAFR
ncbi:hypothetical protein SANTM175S_09194 [Streptomyces antimycoticus]